MNKAIKVLLINVAVVFVFTLLFFLSAGGGFRANDFLIGFGLVSLGAALISLLVSVILFITGPNQYDIAKGFLLSAGVLLLAGFAACSSSSFNLH